MTALSRALLATMLVLASACAAREVDLAKAKVRCDDAHPCPAGRECGSGGLCLPTEAAEGEGEGEDCVPELCNGLDDDCDGAADENDRPVPESLVLVFSADSA